MQSFMTGFSYKVFTGECWLRSLSFSSGFTEYKKFQGETQVFPEKSNNSSLCEDRQSLYKKDASQ